MVFWCLDRDRTFVEGYHYDCVGLSLSFYFLIYYDAVGKRGAVEIPIRKLLDLKLDFACV